ncbi:hypothetical protein HWV62_37093 [Athelia sp. TMB]|nr:hypothetical protein HWV62_37093 [Athelia sp. TMB]
MMPRSTPNAWPPTSRSLQQHRRLFSDPSESDADLLIRTSDDVSFHLHSEVLLAQSENFLGNILKSFPNGHHDGIPLFTVSETAAVFTIVVCAIYNLPYTDYDPSFLTLDAAVDAMRSYGLPVAALAGYDTPLFDILLTHAPTHPLSLFALAAHHDLEPLAIAASAHLTAFPLADINDEEAARIGALYLKRLFFMHLGREEALRRLLLPHLVPHAPTEECSATDQLPLLRAWALAASALAWDSNGDLAPAAIRAALTPLGTHLTCVTCLRGLEDRIDVVTRNWACTKRTI